MSVRILHGDCRDVLPIADIQRIVGQHFGISREEMLGPVRKKGLVRPRMIAMFLSREYSGASYPRIGRAFGGRDHTTILNAMRRVPKFADNAVMVKLRRKLNYAAEIHALDALSGVVHMLAADQLAWEAQEPAPETVKPAPARKRKPPRAIAAPLPPDDDARLPGTAMPSAFQEAA